MRNLWREEDAASYAGDLSQGIYAARLLGQETSLVLPGAGGVSVKTHEKNIFGEPQDILFISGQGCHLDTITENDMVPLVMARLLRLAELPHTGSIQLESELAISLAHPTPATPSSTALWHALLPSRYVLYARPVAVRAIAALPDGLERLRTIYSRSAIVARAGQTLLEQVQHSIGQVDTDGAGIFHGIIFGMQGVASFGESAQEVYRWMIALVTLAEDYLAECWGGPTVAAETARLSLQQCQALALLRQKLAQRVGQPLVVVTDLPSFDETDASYKVTDTSASSYGLARFHEEEIVAFGRTIEEARLVREVYRQIVEMTLSVKALTGQSLPQAARIVETELRDLVREPPAQMFAGEVALITGAASGIGKACAESFLARGAAVVGLDINTHITQLFGRPDFMAICCDVTDESAVKNALETTVSAFGGLDMLVLNAGIFPAGRDIRQLPLGEWQRVFRINLDANLVLLREAHPLLKAAPRGGRVLVNGSRNVPAPGPGAAAYSASKAALTQLARVAALEWGKDGIRVNVIHPHGVFDTGIWTEDVLRTRAARYGMTIAQYKTNNLLHTEINSHDIGELAAEMCGPIFAKTTGAQVPIDGGSERVI